MIAAVGAGTAAAAEISVISTTYSTDLSLEFDDPFRGVNIAVSEAITSSSPISTSRDITAQAYPGYEDSSSGWPRIAAKADADLLSVATDTQHRTPDGGHSWATAESVLSFRTLQDLTVPLSFDFLLLGTPYSAGFVSLFDQTSGLTLFSYSWDCCGFVSSTVPWSLGGSGYTASITVDQWLLASHTYELALHGSTYAKQDSQSLRIAASGLTPIAAPVPEPQTYALMLVGLCVVGGGLWRNRRGVVGVTPRLAP
jgi:hypothetical protein